MAFTAILDSVSKAGDPTRVEINVTYRDDANPDWRQSRLLPITLDPALSPTEQRAAIVAAVRADASPYFRQLAAYAGLTALVGQSIIVSA